MREIVFLKKNEKKWKKAEHLLENISTVNPDTIADLYLGLTDDLAFAQTNYPDSPITRYLNGMTSEIYLAIYRNKREKKGRILDFWLYELPLEFRKAHKELLVAFLIFAVSVVIGVISTAYDDSFPRVILGDAYVNQTLENIRKGDPMAIYKSADEGSMFSYIALNNIKVSFMAFTWGLLFSVGTAYILFQNGVMLGAFQWFFYKQGLFLTSFLAIWIHGTLEISAIVISGAAGIVLGNSFLFPGTHTRIHSLLKGARRALKICVALIPIFIVAAFLESFVTRHTDMPLWLNILILALSLFFILGYFVVYPIVLEVKEKKGKDAMMKSIIQMFNSFWLYMIFSKIRSNKEEKDGLQFQEKHSE